MAFQARYESRCSDCGETIHMGDLIEHDDEPSADDFRVTRYVHAVCDADDPTGLKPGETVCTECWLVKPCECEVA